MDGRLRSAAGMIAFFAVGLCALAAALIFLLKGQPVEVSEEQASAINDQTLISALPSDAEPSAAFVAWRERPTPTGYEILGEVRNTSGAFLDRPEVVAVWKDARGTELARASGYAWREMLAPNGKCPLTISLEQPIQAATITYEVKVARLDVAPIYAPGLTVTPDTPQRDGPSWVFTGTIRNTGDRAARHVAIDIVGSTASGHPTLLQRAFARADVLPPGGQARFRLTAPDVDPSPARFEFTAYGRAVD